MYSSQLKIYRILIFAGSVWFTTVVLLYINWEALIERQERFDEFLMFKQSDRKKESIERNNFVEVLRETEPQLPIQSTRTIRKLSEVIANLKELKKKRIISYKDSITTISPEVYKLLNLPLNAGANGNGISIRAPPPHIKKKIDEGWSKHEFNEFVSDLISVNRTLMDIRSHYCKTQTNYSTNLPKTSVIIIFHNEAWSTLLRSIHSVLNQSPPELIEEIILVDDFSNMSEISN
jgi:polypeptide N-acetylgalactosaminyltransferase